MSARSAGGPPIGPEIVDDVVSRLAALDPSDEDAAFEGLAVRQPDLHAFVLAVSEDMPEGADEVAENLLLAVEEMFRTAHGAPRAPAGEDDVRRGYERVLSLLEESVAAGGTLAGLPTSQPHVLEYVREALAQPLEDDDGEAAALVEEDRTDLELAFRAVIEVLGERPQAPR